MPFLQPADWQEQDIQFKYTVDVFGRTDKGEVAQVRLTGFRPYFYLRMVDGETSAKIQDALEQSSGKKLRGISITLESKLDAMRGFNSLAPIKVWKLSFPALWMFKTVSKTLKNAMRIGTRKIVTEDIFEANLPPLIRLFHEKDISPASPFEFEADDFEPDETVNVDVFYEVDYTTIKTAPNEKIPLLVAGYDIETYSVSGLFPVATNPGDEIMQIGLSFRYSNDLLSSGKRIVFSNGTITPSDDPDVKYVECKNERDLLQKFETCIKQENPDVIAGFNTFGFDDSYIADRAERHKIHLDLGRTQGSSWKDDYVKTEKKTFELASGKFAVRYFEMPGRLPVDLLLSVRREQNLDSYKLDNVANTFLRDKVTNLVIICSAETRMYEIHTKSTRGLFVGNLVRFDVVGNTINPYANGMKFKVKQIFPKKFVIELEEHNYLCTFDDLSAEDRKNLEWSFGKDDIDIKDMFAAHIGTPEQRGVVAKYNIQDCDLVLTLMAKLDTLVNARGMADVCKVPIQYIFLRGQGIKIFSAVVYNASKRNQIIMTQESIEGDVSYEGAIVLPPKIGMYLDQPIAVLDFNSLYPSNMIAFNLSPDTLVYVKTYDAKGKNVKQEGFDEEEVKRAGYTIDEIGYDLYDDDKNPIGRTVCGFVQPTSDTRTIGVLPLTLDILLKKRKETRKIMESVEDDAQKAVLNGLQLAYKVVANSVYGQCGSRTSPIRKMEVAACTTAAGRDRIYFAKGIVEKEFGGDVIYGDTDSIFIKFPTTDLAESIRLGQESAARITSLCRKAHKIEYEKTMFPFILFCRKRYVGMLYETDVTKCYRKTMGVALKRRDNAPIVKDIFGGALDILMDKRDIRPAQEFVKQMLVKVLKNELPLDKYIITKQLRDDYKKPEQIAHRVLADRMAERDAGTAPQLGDRLPYIYVANRKDEKKQGDKIEHLDYVKAKGLKPDTEFYITNQIQNPVAQLFALSIENLDGYKPKHNYEKMLHDFMENGLDEEEATLKVLDKKEKELDSILFMGAQYLTKHKRGPMDMFLNRK
jgi:DNA polymerase elongation subunit (family B)